mgnify:FL=1|jgi:predicted RNA-binding protein (TIGR00451 family)
MYSLLEGNRIMDTKKNSVNILEKRQLEAVIYYQYGVELSLDVERNQIEVTRSRKTGRIKQIFLNKKYFASLRAKDGFIIPSIYGWKYIASASASTLPCIEIKEDIAQFIADGKTLFSKHVVRAHADILPGDEVCIKTVKGEIIASGKAILPGTEMGIIRIGKAVKTRKTAKNS